MDDSTGYSGTEIDKAHDSHALCISSSVYDAAAAGSGGGCGGRVRGGGGGGEGGEALTLALAEAEAAAAAAFPKKEKFDENQGHSLG